MAPRTTQRGFEFKGYRLINGKTPAGVPTCEVRLDGKRVRVFYGRHAREEAKSWVLQHPKEG